MNSNIKFEIKSKEDLNSIYIYRNYGFTEDGEPKWSYIDSCHAMSKMELLVLKNFLQEYLQNNDWY